MSGGTLQPRTSVSLDTYVVDCSWSSDSRSLAVAGGEGGVFGVDNAVQSPKVQELGEHGMGVLAVAWQPDRNSVASSGQDGTVTLWSVDRTTEPKRLRRATSWSEHVAFSSDGTLLAASTGKTVTVWNGDGEPLHESAPHPGSVSSIAWDRSGRDLAAATFGGVWIHRLENGALTTRQYKWSAAALSVSFSPSGKVLAAGMQDGSVHFWYLASGDDSEIRGYGTKVPLIEWSANSRYLATGAGSEVIVWDFTGKGPEGSTPLELKGHTERVVTLAFQPNGPWLVSGGKDWRVSLWLPGKAEHALDAHLTSAEVTVTRWSPDGRYLAVGEANGKLSVYELMAGAGATKSANRAR
jgi:WD40 repeat protein